MDGNQSTPVPEQRPASPEVGADQLKPKADELKVAPVAAENAGGKVKTDDGVAGAQQQVASAADPADPAATTQAKVVTPLPATAADVDVIEPEWVKKAEKAVDEHRDDPRAEEAAVEEVQREYLKARYNIDVEPGDKP